MSKDKFLWKTNDGLVEISEMRTSHIINAIKLVNRMAKSDPDYEYPEGYDFMYQVLNARGVDTDMEID
tara:strand:- start:415 stop:618 length:204 start_codon:yes stop_codon:yes gene_type:complete